MVQTEDIQQARENQVAQSSLQDLLDWDGTIDVTDTIEFPERNPRPAITVTVRAVSDDEIEECSELATMKATGRNGMPIRDLDYAMYKKLVVYRAVVSPDLSDSVLQEKFNKGRHYTLILNKLFLPGEQLAMFNRINELSGYPSEDDVEFKTKADSDLS